MVLIEIASPPNFQPHKKMYTEAVMFLLLFFVIVAVIYIVSRGKDEGDERLFLIYADDVKVNSDDSTIELTFDYNKHNEARTFSNIPKHYSFSIGNIMNAFIIFNTSSKNPVKKFFLDHGVEPDQHILDTYKNYEASNQSFVEMNPNSTLSFVKKFLDHEEIKSATNNYPTTIAKLISFTNENKDSFYKMKFEYLKGEEKIESGDYSHVSITLDNILNLSSCLNFVSVVATNDCNDGVNSLTHIYKATDNCSLFGWSVFGCD